MTTIRAFRPISHILLCLSTLVLILGNTVIASAQAPTFGIHPKETSIGYYQFSLAPGESIEDTLIVNNPNDFPLALNVLMVRGLTMSTGGITFAEDASGAAQWVAFPAAGVVELDPNSEKELPFQLNVPADALPGEYVVGFLGMLQDSSQSPVVEGNTGGSESSFKVKVISQVAISMIITVTGDTVCTADITSVTSTSRKGSWKLAIAIQNTGTAHFNATGDVIARPAAGGDPVASSPFTVGYFIPGDTIDLPVTLNPYPAAGDYTVEVTLVTNCGYQTTFSQPVTISSEEVQQAASEAVAEQPATASSDEAAKILAQAELVRSIGLSLGGLAVLILVIGLLMMRRKSN